MGKIYGKSGSHYRYEPTDKRGKGALEFWAENGMICLIDERAPSGDADHFTVLTVREFLMNVRAINFEIERCANSAGRASMAAGGGSPGGAAAEEREALHKLVADAIECAKQARNQGDPVNPRHAADMMMARRKSMLLAGVPQQRIRDGAVSQDIAPESAKLPPLPRASDSPPTGKGKPGLLF